MRSSLNRQAFGILIGLVIQYVFGMAINLFVRLPASEAPGELWRFTITNALTLSHFIIGTILVIGAIAIILQVFKDNIEHWKVPAVIGLLWLLVAWGAGESFVTTKLSALSYVMSLGFLLAVFSYGWGLYLSRGITVRKTPMQAKTE